MVRLSYRPTLPDAIKAGIVAIARTDGREPPTSDQAQV